MAFRMRPDQPLAAEARRIADKQLQLALAGLAAAHGVDGDRRIHTARRHVKKVRALIRLLEPRVDSGERQRQRRLRKAARVLGAIADSEALVRTLDVLLARHPGALPADEAARVRSALRAREFHVHQLAESTGALSGAAAQLAAERGNVRTWRLDAGDVAAVRRGLRRGARRGRRAMQRALASPTTRTFSVWRRRVKNLWFQLRLIEACTGGAFSGDQRRLEQLDGLLGEAHNCALLAAALRTRVLRLRADTAQCLRLVRRYRNDLRREARALAPLVHGITPRELVDRAERAWHVEAPAASGATVTSWPRSA